MFVALLDPDVGGICTHYGFLAIQKFAGLGVIGHAGRRKRPEAGESPGRKGRMILTRNATISVQMAKREIRRRSPAPRPRAPDHPADGAQECLR